MKTAVRSNVSLIGTGHRVIILTLITPDIEYKTASVFSLLSPALSALSPASSICTLQRIFDLFDLLPVP